MNKSRRNEALMNRFTERRYQLNRVWVYRGDGVRALEVHFVCFRDESLRSMGGIREIEKLVIRLRLFMYF